MCGTDGTPAANLAITQTISVQPPPPPIVPDIATTTHATPSATPTANMRRSALNMPKVDKTQVGHEARAKVFWGDSEEEVIKFLMINGFAIAEANEIFQTAFQERAEVIRKHGMGKIIISVPLMIVPVIAFFLFRNMGIFPMKLFALTVMVGLYGFYLLIKGTIMFVSPKSEPGDVADK
jgi:hypothetical protein